MDHGEGERVRRFSRRDVCLANLRDSLSSIKLS